ncbi:MAG: hypothetical protein JOZ08_17025 [Verrucomicrobia bacterium]|nr:hypothetical protein [Verrucomicrobiota bacterium]MBV8273724.1 hypothetical protein [Verrucomicrobiota bacterium]
MRSRFYLSLSALALVLCGSVLAAEEAPQTDQYEAPGPVNAQDFLPKSAFSGKKVFVDKTAQNDGLQNTYVIRAGTQEYEVKGSAGTMEFLQELRAINELRQISTSKAFTQGLKASAKGTYQSGKQIVRDPVGAVKKVPEGASKFFGRVKGFFNDDEEDGGQASSAGDTVKGLLGFDKAKAKLAARVGVDVYSRNQALQDELDRLASAAAGGGLAFDIGTLPIGGAVGVGLTVIGVQQTVDSLINDSSPASLRNWNEENLIKLGANRDLVFQFINHPWYTLRQITVITASLAAAKINPDLFLEFANKALTPADGRYFEQVAELLAVYSQKVEPLQSLRLQDGLLCAVDANGALIVPVSLDYAVWTPKVADRVDGLAGVVGGDSAIKAVKIYTDGKASERVRSELSKRGIEYQSVVGKTD